MLTRIRRRGWGVMVILAAGQACAGQTDPPRLVVVVTVDQMRADDLDRFGPQFEHGLARLMDGARFTNAHHDHAATFTAVGHATLGTGVYPARHGIVNNSWYDRAADEWIYAALDAEAQILGEPDAPGRSPRFLERAGLGDWMQETYPTGGVYSVSLKDRAAVLSAGQRPDGVYWYRNETGRFTTSTYYGRELPAWLVAFNRESTAAHYRDSVWTLQRPESAYGASREDAFSAEAGTFGNTFPHRWVDDGSTPLAQWLIQTPFADAMVLGLARALVTHEGLGRDATPDLLFVNLSATDYIGHTFGPYSREMHDHQLRLDVALGGFFAHLDSVVGSGRYVVALSSDHGVVPLPEESRRRGADARRVSSEEMDEVVARAVAAAATALGEPPPQTRRLANGVAFVFATAPTDDRSRVWRREVATRLAEWDALAAVFSRDSVATASLAGDDVLARFRRSFHPDRGPDVFLLFKPLYLRTSQMGGTTHGSAHWYDTHVPLIVWGPGIDGAVHEAQVATADLAPTLATIMRVPVPTDVDGRVLTEAVGRRASSPRPE